MVVRGWGRTEGKGAYRLSEDVENAGKSDDRVCNNMKADVVLWLKTSMAPFPLCDQAGGGVYFEIQAQTSRSFCTIDDQIASAVSGGSPPIDLAGEVGEPISSTGFDIATTKRWRVTGICGAEVGPPRNIYRRVFNSSVSSSRTLRMTGGVDNAKMRL